jgi:hypothetical protein
MGGFTYTGASVSNFHHHQSVAPIEPPNPPQRPPSAAHMNPYLDRLQPYPFEKLAELKRGIEPNPNLSPIALSIGEPKHPTPAFIGETLLAHLHQLSAYPNTRGLALLRETIADWLTRRFQLPAASLDPERQVLPVNGTREALFAFAQAVVDARARRAGADAEPLLSDLRGRGAARRRDTALSALHRRNRLRAGLRRRRRRDLAPLPVALSVLTGQPHRCGHRPAWADAADRLGPGT